MNEATARKILKGYAQPDGGLYCLGRYLNWPVGEEHIRLDDMFSAEELEAIAWWMRHAPLMEETEAREQEYRK